MTERRPHNCRNRLRDEGKAYPRSTCEACRYGGLIGCPWDMPDAGAAAKARADWTPPKVEDAPAWKRTGRTVQPAMWGGTNPALLVEWQCGALKVWTEGNRYPQDAEINNLATPDPGDFSLADIAGAKLRDRDEKLRNLTPQEPTP